MRPPQLVVALAAVAIVGAAVYIAVFLRLPVERPLAYWPVDERTLEVVFLDAPDLDCSVSQVVETGDEVRIHAQCLKSVLPLAQTGMAHKYVITTTLQDPLGSRAVYDGLGNLADRCQLPGLDCVAP